MKKTEIKIYADDSAQYVSAETNDKLINFEEESSKALSKWLVDNRLRGNTDKCHLLVSGT